MRRPWAVAFETAARYLHIHNEAAQAIFRQENNLGVKDLGLAEPVQFIESGMAAALNTRKALRPRLFEGRAARTEQKLRFLWCQCR